MRRNASYKQHSLSSTTGWESGLNIYLYGTYLLESAETGTDTPAVGAQDCTAEVVQTDMQHFHVSQQHW
jgi:hypothetical protein